jgi:hypothetical protein
MSPFPRVDDEDKKQLFLNWLAEFLEDGADRYFVPEVNSSEDDLWSIGSNMECVNIRFGFGSSD